MRRASRVGSRGNLEFYSNPTSVFGGGERVGLPGAGRKAWRVGRRRRAPVAMAPWVTPQDYLSNNKLGGWTHALGPRWPQWSVRTSELNYHSWSSSSAAIHKATIKLHAARIVIHPSLKPVHRTARCGKAFSVQDLLPSRCSQEALRSLLAKLSCFFFLLRRFFFQVKFCLLLEAATRKMRLRYRRRLFRELEARSRVRASTTRGACCATFLHQLGKLCNSVSILRRTFQCPDYALRRIGARVRYRKERLDRYFPVLRHEEGFNSLGAFANGLGWHAALIGGG